MSLFEYKITIIALKVVSKRKLNKYFNIDNNNYVNVHQGFDMQQLIITFFHSGLSKNIVIHDMGSTIDRISMNWEQEG